MVTADPVPRATRKEKQVPKTVPDTNSAYGRWMTQAGWLYSWLSLSKSNISFSQRDICSWHLSIFQTPSFAISDVDDFNRQICIIFTQIIFCFNIFKLRLCYNVSCYLYWQCFSLVMITFFFELIDFILHSCEYIFKILIF